MTFCFRLIVPAALTFGLLPAATAFAADYDPPVYVDEAPEYVPVEVGSGWYLRGDVGYNTNNPFKNEAFTNVPNIPTDQRTFGQDEVPVFAGVGFGYHWNDYFRTEANIGYLSRDETNLTRNVFDANSVLLSAERANADNDLYYGTINAYADLGTYAGFTPYIGGGVGLVSASQSYSYDFDDPNTAINDINISYDKDQFEFAYTLGAGVSYAATKNLSVDFGYQYFSSPDAEYVTIDTPSTYTINKGIDYHQVKVGLRYDLW